ncbi:hypothetical protein TPHA_0A00560 [Tetrapisispora phaffii CBS 4417]|uniref:Rab-GAP TBC domain-containing protein n=1 Tax=Tetrapisispora phaffii (strain ATCC 24235 / CBS 4417 / NBRC 1672 / NRRL Y-8282 / UCD 70-5) TaxID=1071381 RepID=G8BML3_TETPH|nr:hypothetical protein TPHA_0A00560 [Tetrapisispora phaffii CBS 4417]CCE61141.1 hypothetical protein TPHA_0A00560 [Tetrapisispora phaffii CBS 4417]
MLNRILDSIGGGLISKTTVRVRSIQSEDGTRSAESSEAICVPDSSSSSSELDSTLNQTDMERGVAGFAIGPINDDNIISGIISSYENVSIADKSDNSDELEERSNSENKLLTVDIKSFDILNTVSCSTDVIIAQTTDVNDYDRYGFRKQSRYISKQDYDNWCDSYSIQCGKKKLKWEKYMESSGLACKSELPTRFPPKSEKFLNLVREGVPSEWRGNVWWHLVRGQYLLNKNKDTYKSLLLKVKEYQTLGDTSKLPEGDVIERDLNRTFPNNIHFQKEPFQNNEPKKITSLRNILLAYSIYNRDIGYCQSMNFLTGFLLLFMNEEKTFWMLVIITRRFLPGVHNLDLEGVNIDQGVLMLLMEGNLPTLWPYIEATCKSHSNKPYHLRRTNEFLHALPPITLCTASWFMCCFIGILPVETTLRVLDCLFYEGSSFLFRVSVNLIKLAEESILKDKPYETLFDYLIGSDKNSDERAENLSYVNADELNIEFFQVLQRIPRQLLDCDNFFDKVLFKRRASFKRFASGEGG